MLRVRGALALLVASTVGFGGVAMAANPYPPPSSGSAQVVPSRIRAGECAVFSGDGFAPATRLDIADNGAPDGTTLSTSSGTFSIQLCFPTDAKRGRHTLSATGRGSDGSQLTVSAVLTIEGVRQSPASGGQAGSTAGPAATDAGPTTTVTAPQAGSGPQGAPPPGGESAIPPLHGDNRGVTLLALTGAGLLAAFLLSAWLLLAARRRRKEREDELALDTLGV